MKTKIKKSIICKDIKQYSINWNINRTHQPQAGDVAIFQVMKNGKHTAIQNDSGKNSYIFPGDFIMMAFGTRYASNQFEGYIPEGFQEEYHILGQGGVVGTVATQHAKMAAKGGPTTLKLFGFVTDEQNKVINTRFLAHSRVMFNPNRPKDYQIILSVGASMDSGKTTSAAYLCRGLNRAGKRVAYIKLTGTVFSKDKRYAADCGADMAIDFSHFGYPSTFMCSQEEILDIFEGLLRKVETIKPDFVVVEIADGLLQRETSMLLNNETFMNQVDEVMLSCGDSLSVLSGLEYLRRIGHPPFAISGLINTAPLLAAEVRQTVHTPLLDLGDLSDKAILRRFQSNTNMIKRKSA